MIIAPVQIKTDDGKTIDGILLEEAEAQKVIELIDRSNADGLKGDDAIFLMRLKESLKDLVDRDKE